MGELLAVAALILFSTNIIVTKAASALVPVNFGFLISVIVNVLAASVLVGARLAIGGRIPEIKVMPLIVFALAGFFTTYLGRWLLYDSVVRLGPSRASSFQITNPMFTVLIAWFFLGESLTRVDAASSVAILIGLYMVSGRPPAPEVSKPIDHETSIESGGIRSTGVCNRLGVLLASGSLLALTGALCYAVGNALRGVAIQNWNEPVLGVLVGAIAGLLAYVILGSASRTLKGQFKRADRNGVYLYAASGLLTVLAQACMVAAIRYAPVSIVSLISLSTPVLVMPLGYFLLRNRERLLPRTVIGSCVILTGVSALLLT